MRVCSRAHCGRFCERLCIGMSVWPLVRLSEGGSWVAQVQGHTNLPDFTRLNWPNLPFVLTFFGPHPAFF